MQTTINERLGLYHLDEHYSLCDAKFAKNQLERYRSGENKLIVSVSKYTGTYSYSVGDSVNVLPYLYVTQGYKMLNVIEGKVKQR